MLIEMLHCIIKYLSAIYQKMCFTVNESVVILPINVSEDICFNSAKYIVFSNLKKKMDLTVCERQIFAFLRF